MNLVVTQRPWPCLHPSRDRRLGAHAARPFGLPNPAAGAGHAMHRASGMRQHGAGSPPATATGATGAKGFTSASIATRPPAAAAAAPKLPWIGLHHVGLLCANLEASIAFYRDVLGMEVNVARPDDRLAYRGAWLWIGPDMVHLMELPNPDPLEGRPQHGGKDRHFAIGMASIDGLVEALKAAQVPHTLSASGRPAVFFRDPDANTLECMEVQPWR